MPASCSVEVSALESFCRLGDSSSTSEDPGFFQTVEHESRTSIGDWIEKTKYMFSPIIKHFFVSLFAVVHAAEYAPNSWHSAQGSFIPKGGRALHCGDVFLGKIVVPRFVGQQHQRKKQRTKLDRSKRFLGTLGLGMSEGTKKRGCDSCAAEVSMERSKGGNDLRLEAARYHKCVTDNEKRCGQACSERDGLKEVDTLFRP